MSVVKNIGFGLRMRGVPAADIAARVAKATALVQLTGQAHKLPGQLSGGQQQRVAIARAIVNDPQIIVADEPTGDLDRKTADEILTLLQELNRVYGKTIVMVTHDPQAAKYARRTVHLDKGVIVDGEGAAH